MDVGVRATQEAKAERIRASALLMGQRPEPQEWSELSCPLGTPDRRSYPKHSLRSWGKLSSGVTQPGTHKKTRVS